MNNNFKQIFILVAIFLIAIPMWSEGQKEESVKVSTVLKTDSALESPMLTEMVKSGEIEALEARLPMNPLVEPLASSSIDREIGLFGGVMRKVWRGAGKDKWGSTKMMEEYLMRYEDGKIVPNVAQSVEILNDSKQFIFHLRDGMKWSDGVDFTANDVLFYWEEILMKKATGKGPHASLLGATVSLIDDYTFEIVFPTSRNLFLIDFMSAREFFTPAHYAKTILPDFIGAEKAAEMANEMGFSDTQAMLKQKLYYFWLYSDVPMLTAWVPMNKDSANIYKLKRNSYYWKVDEQGKQLPYIDYIDYYRVEDTSAYALKAIAGDIDFQFRSVSPTDYSLLKTNEAQGNYKVVVWKDSGNRSITFNPTIEDPILAKIFGDPRFRKAVSHAINRTEILDMTDSLAEAKQTSFIEQSKFYSESWSKAYTEFSLEKANELLDSMDLVWDDKKEYRLRADGEVLEILFLHRLSSQEELANVELVASYLKKAGLKIIAKQVDRTLLQELRDNNKIEMDMRGVQELDLLVDNKNYVPVRSEEVQWGEYGTYIESEGEKGIKPVGDMALLVEYWNNLNATSPGPEQDAWGKKIVELHEKNLWIIGISGNGPALGIVNGDMMNVPDHVPTADILRSPGNAKPWQFFYNR